MPIQRHGSILLLIANTICYTIDHNILLLLYSLNGRGQLHELLQFLEKQVDYRNKVQNGAWPDWWA